MDLEASDDLGKSSSSIKAGVREMEVGVASETGRPASPPLSFPSEAHFSSEARASSTLGAGRAPNNSTDDIPWSDVDPTQRSPAPPTPLRKLTTTSLIDVYKRINRDFYEQRSLRESKRSSRNSARSADADPPSGLNMSMSSRGRNSADGSRRDRRHSHHSHSWNSGGTGKLFQNEALGGLSNERSNRTDFMSSGGRGGVGTTTRDSQNVSLDTSARDILHDRYVVGRVIGAGAFARVVLGYDIITDTRVAVKIVKNNSKQFHAQARKELAVLKTLGEKNGHPNVVTLLDSFTTNMEQFTDNTERKAEEEKDSDKEKEQNDSSNLANPGFRCLVFELLSHSLYDVLRVSGFRGVSLGLVRKFSFQILSALDFLRKHNVVHLDLKPENVLLCSTDRSAVKLVDFGSSCFLKESGEFMYAQSRYYRAVEVLLGLPYGFPVDMWSLGCIVVELHGGKPLFPGKDERNQLGKIVETLGAVPGEMFGKCSSERREAFRESIGRDAGPDTSGNTGRDTSDSQTKHKIGTRPLRTVLAHAARAFESRKREVLESGKFGTVGDDAMDDADAINSSLNKLSVNANVHGESSEKESDDSSLTEVALFCDLVERAMTYNPDERLTPKKALEHPFFSELKGKNENFQNLDADDDVEIDHEMLMFGFSSADG